MGIVRRTDGPATMPGFHSLGAGFEAPFEMLTACHDRVERMLVLLARLQQHLLEQGLDDAARQAARDVMRYFDIAAPLHHEDEERHVFPPLLAGQDLRLRLLVERLLLDHRAMEAAWPEARKVLSMVAESPEKNWAPLTPTQTIALACFAALYDQHLAAENGLAYPAAQALLTQEEFQAMSLDMMERRGVGATHRRSV